MLVDPLTSSFASPVLASPAFEGGGGGGVIRLNLCVSATDLSLASCLLPYRMDSCLASCDFPSTLTDCMHVPCPLALFFLFCSKVLVGSKLFWRTSISSLVSTTGSSSMAFLPPADCTPSLRFARPCRQHRRQLQHRQSSARARLCAIRYDLVVSAWWCISPPLVALICAC
jgi:hypothetical protein